MGTHKPRKVWNLWKTDPPKITVEQAVGYMLQNMKAHEGRLDEHTLKFVQLAKQGKIPPTSKDEMIALLGKLKAEYQAENEALEKDLHQFLEAHTQMTEDALTEIRADIEALQKQVILPQKLLWKLFDLLEEALLFLAGAIDRITHPNFLSEPPHQVPFSGNYLYSFLFGVSRSHKPIKKTPPHNIITFTQN